MIIWNGAKRPYYIMLSEMGLREGLKIIICMIGVPKQFPDDLSWEVIGQAPHNFISIYISYLNQIRISIKSHVLE